MPFLTVALPGKESCGCCSGRCEEALFGLSVLSRTFGSCALSQRKVSLSASEQAQRRFFRPQQFGLKRLGATRRFESTIRSWVITKRLASGLRGKCELSPSIPDRLTPKAKNHVPTSTLSPSGKKTSSVIAGCSRSTAASSPAKRSKYGPHRKRF